MSKVVSTKYGDRHLVHLPAVSMSGTETPAVHTLVPGNRRDTVYTNRTKYAGNYQDTSRMAKGIPKEYAYRDQNLVAGQGNQGNTYTAGNIITTGTHGDGLGNVVWNQLYPQPSVPPLPNYPQGQEGYMQYTQHGLSTLPQQQQGPAIMPHPQPQGFGVTQPQQQGQALQIPNQHQPTQQVHNDGTNPKEKHIYYGPDGNVIPGPPRGYDQVESRDRLSNFAIEGILYGGRLTAIQVLDQSGTFPKIPDYLVRDLFKKYHTFNKTLVTIIAKGGEISVHAVPQLTTPRVMQPQTQYVPVYVDENDEPVDQQQMYGYSNRRYASPHISERSYPDLDRGYSRRSRPATKDPISDLRWKKVDDTESVTSYRPVERPDTDRVVGKTVMEYI